MSHREYEVRCCCDPGKLLGRIMWPDMPGTRRRFLLMPKHPAHISLFEPSQFVELELKQLHIGDSRSYMAVSSNHLPIEELRRVPGFKETS